MKQIYFIIFLLASLLNTPKLYGQKAVRDSSITIPAISIHYAYEMLNGDIAQRYGNFHNLGGEFSLKLKNNFILGLDASILFGPNVNNQESYFKNIQTDHGYVIDGNGQYAEVYLSMRGLSVFIFTGYQFNFWAPNPNSGPFLQVGGGLLQHNVKIDNPGNVAPQITGEYAKMYDRLSNGFSLTETIGYRYYGNHNLMNFYIGLEFTQAWTKSRRDYNADDLKRDNADKLDLLMGLKVGWTIPLYGRAPKDFYYY
jgi:hypothetical protein